MSEKSVDSMCASREGRALLLWTERPPSYWDVVGNHLPLALLSGVVLLVAFFIPLRWIPVRACTFLTLTGYPCPFCGFSRTFQALAVGRWQWAWDNAPLAVFWYAGTVLLFAWNAAALLLGVRIRRGRLLTIKPGYGRRLTVVLGVLLLLNWAYRIFMGFA